MNNSKEQLDKLELMIIKIDDKLDLVDKTLVRNTESLEQHIRRTDILESYVKEQIVKEDLEPIKKHVGQVTFGIRAIFWFCSIIGSIAAFILVLKQLSYL